MQSAIPRNRSSRACRVLLAVVALASLAGCGKLKKLHEKLGSGGKHEQPAESPGAQPAEAPARPAAKPPAAAAPTPSTAPSTSPGPVTPKTAIPDLAFTLESYSFEAGEAIVITFTHAVPAEGGTWWITVVGMDKPDTDWGNWTYVNVGEEEATLYAPSDPGAYEVRLHANYPEETTHVVTRVPLTVTH